MNTFVSILLILYSVWAVYSGYRFLSGRSMWLDDRRPINMICKWVLSLVVGYFIGVFFFIILILKLIGIIAR